MKKLVNLEMTFEQVHMIESSLVCKIINVENDIELIGKVYAILKDQKTRNDLEKLQRKLTDYQNLLTEIRRSY